MRREFHSVYCDAIDDFRVGNYRLKLKTISLTLLSALCSRRLHSEGTWEGCSQLLLSLSLLPACFANAKLTHTGFVWRA